MSRNNSWEQICARIQQRSLDSTCLEIKSANKLYAEILKCLTNASNDKILTTKVHEIHGLLKFPESSKTQSKGYFEIMGGDKNFHRDQNIPHFKRHDGCWFDFAITIDETKSPAQIIGFDFEVRFPVGCSPSFLRFDLNLPGHDNEERNIRFHMHPSSDDIMIHSPPMNPIEILHLFLYGLELPKKPRS